MMNANTVPTSSRIRGFLLVLATLLGTSCSAASNDDLDAQTVARCEFSFVVASSIEALFSDVGELDVDSQGHIYIMDYEKPVVTVLSPDGSVLRTMGREGQGPGEFGWVRRVQILPGDSLMVYDQKLGRITVFLPHSDEVAYVTNLNLAGFSSPAGPDWVEKLPGQNAFLAAATPPFMPSDDPAGDYRRTMTVRLFDDEGSLLRDSVLLLPGPQTGIVARRGRTSSIRQNPFGRPGLLRLGPQNRLYYGWGDSLAVRVYSLEGQQVGGFSLPHEAPAITGQDLENAVGSEASATTFRRPLETFVKEQASGKWPAFKQFVVDDRGRIWIGLLTPAGQPTEWVAFTPSGDRICSTSLPENVELKLVRGNTAYGVATDEETDVPRVVVYRVGGLPTTGSQP